MHDTTTQHKNDKFAHAFGRSLILIAILFLSTALQTPSSEVPTVVTEVEEEITRSEKEAVFATYVTGFHEALNAPGLDEKVLGYALQGYWRMMQSGKLVNHRYLSIADFSQSANEPRLYIVDMHAQQLVMQIHVAHGMSSGGEFAKHFSNESNSGKSSLGFFLTGETYKGRRGHSLKLDGQERSYNTNVRSRGVVIHAAEYATSDFIRKNGRLGRSQGCPAIAPELNHEVIALLKDKSCFFIYANDRSYLRYSKFIKGSLHLDAFYAAQMLNC